jgi:hypothetical protein
MSLYPALASLLTGVSSWTEALADFAAGLVVAIQWRRPAPPVASIREPLEPLQPAHQWDIVTGIVRTGIAQVEAAAILHANAAQQIAAADYALGRMLEECALIMPQPAVALPPPLREVVREPAPILEQLAA